MLRLLLIFSLWCCHFVTYSIYTLQCPASKCPAPICQNVFALNTLKLLRSIDYGFYYQNECFFILWVNFSTLLSKFISFFFLHTLAHGKQREQFNFFVQTSSIARPTKKKERFFVLLISEYKLLTQLKMAWMSWSHKNEFSL